MREKQSGGAAAILNQFPLLVTLIAAGLIFLLMTGLKGCSKKQDKAEPSTLAPVVTAETPVPSDSAKPAPTEPADSTGTTTDVPTDAPTDPPT